MLACHEAPSMAGHTLVSFALELSVYACMCVYMYTCHVHVCACTHFRSSAVLLGNCPLLSPLSRGRGGMGVWGWAVRPRGEHRYGGMGLSRGA